MCVPGGGCKRAAGLCGEYIPWFSRDHLGLWLLTGVLVSRPTSLSSRFAHEVHIYHTFRVRWRLRTRLGVLLPSQVAPGRDVQIWRVSLGRRQGQMEVAGLSCIYGCPGVNEPWEKGSELDGGAESKLARPESNPRQRQLVGSW